MFTILIIKYSINVLNNLEINRYKIIKFTNIIYKILIIILGIPITIIELIIELPILFIPINIFQKEENKNEF